MVTTFIVLAVIISVLLIIVVLIQKSKGGGLASNFAGSNQLMGVRRTTNFIEKATWTLAAIVAVLAILSGVVMEKSGKHADGPAFDKGNVTTTTTTTTQDIPADILPVNQPATTEAAQ
ncbi:MAG: preprotein translocase subunit SecG [Muribaculaceae bacterium]|nr:preprotein translocase subunit SecG [Muribaculaceae bacterium]